MQKIGTIITLIEYIQSSDNKKQKEAFEKFHELKKMEEFSAYCAAIFSRKSLSIAIRRQSGLLLKEALRHNFRKQNSDADDNTISDSVLNVCKKCLIQCLCEEDENSKFIRDTSAIAITTIVTELHHIANTNMAFSRYSEFDEWPDLISTLLNLLKQHQNDKNPVVLQSILNLIHLLCYDCGKIMGECRDSASLIPALFAFATSSNTEMRDYCLKSLYFLFAWQPQSLLSQIDKYIQVLLHCMSDTNAKIIKCITDSLIFMMNEYWPRLTNNNNKEAMLRIFDFMLNGTMNEDPDVCCTAAEFWALYATDREKNNSCLIEYFPKLIPVLVKRCRFTEDLLSLIDFDNDDQSKADLSEDVAPVFYKSRAERNDMYNGHDSTENGNDGSPQQANRNGMNGPMYGGMMDEEESSWNIRKCCASQLEKLSFAGEETKRALLAIVLPIIKQALESEDFLDREAGLLVLGAITQKEYESIIPSLPDLIPFILKQCKRDKHILVQQIACWSLARFSNWYYTTQEGDQFYEQILYQFLDSMKSSSKRVQRAACGSIATFITSTKEKLMKKQQYVEALMNTFLQAFNNYHLKNFPQLIDVILVCTTAIANFTANQQQQQQNGQHGDNAPADNVLCDAKFQDALLPPIIQRWVAFDGDSNIFPLFEAITQWTLFVGHTQHFQTHYLEQIFLNTLKITVDLKNECRAYAEYIKTVHDDGVIDDEHSENDEDHDASNGYHENGYHQRNGNEPEKPDKEFWVCGLDLLAQLVERCNPAIRRLIWDDKSCHYQRLLEMLYCSICETHFNVRRNGLALLGDLISLHAVNMQAHIGKFLKIVIANLNAEWQTVCTNASWCIGQSLFVFGPNAQNNEINGIPENQDNVNHDDNVMAPHCDQILAHLVDILKSQAAPPYIVTNIAITMARLVQAFPDRIIKKWDQFAVEWITSLAMFQEDQDKIQSFQTLMFVVMKNPIAVVQSRNGCTVLFKSIASWQNPPKTLNDQFQKVLCGFKKAAPNWDHIMNNLDQNTRQTLRNRYNV